MEQFAAVNWPRVLAILLIGTVAWLGVQRVTSLVRNLLVSGEVDLDSEKQAVTLVRVVRYVLGGAVVLIVLMLLLSEFGISIAPLLGAAGIAGVALGLAAQGIARDFLRGVALLLDNQLRVGDIVEIAGKSGVVEELTLRYVRIREYDGTVNFVRTGDIDTVTNRSFGKVFAVLDVAVDTEADVGAAYRIIEASADALRSDPVLGARVLGPVEIAGLERWDDDAVVIRSRILVEPHSQAAVRRALLERIKSGMDQAGIPNPTQRLRLLENRG